MSFPLFSGLGVSKSNYYRWLKNLPNERPEHKLKDEITRLCQLYKYKYGHRKIHRKLLKTTKTSKNTVQKVMQRYNLQCKVKPKKCKKTGQPINVVDNILNRDFTAKRPLEKLVT
ncbi:IS3 family transposase, partial [Acholeplasma equifetale]|uniref:IS3 family transposase n=1 Tax=Acholeplasma equifetale TaxID=264634 RepID=UPI00138B14B0